MREWAVGDIMIEVRILVDGNNLMFALAEVAVDADRARLSRMLGDYAERQGVDVTVVYDGPAPRRNDGRGVGDPRISAYYSGRRTADDVLDDLAGSHSAPRRLTVISRDRAVQRQARRRGCKVVDALAFARQLKVRPAKPAADEPAAKREGLAEGQLDRWLKEFGLADKGLSDGQLPYGL